MKKYEVVVEFRRFVTVELEAETEVIARGEGVQEARIGISNEYDVVGIDAREIRSSNEIQNWLLQ